MRSKMGATGEVYLKDLHPNIGKYIFYKALLSGQFFLIAVLLPIYQRCGLTAGDILRLEVFFAVALTILGIAGAHFADRTSKRRSLLIGIVTYAAGIIQYAFATNFSDLMIAELLIAVALAFQSGAESALVYDSLLETGRKDEHQRVQRITLFVVTMIGCLCSVLSKKVAEYAGDSAAPLLGSLMILGAFPIVWGMKEPNPYDREKRAVHLSDLLAASKEAFRKGSTLRCLIVFAGSLLALSSAGMPLLQPLYAERGIDPAMLGWVVGGVNVLSVLCLIFFQRAEKALCGIHANTLFALIVGMMYLLLGLVPGIGSLILILPLFWVKGVFEVFFVDEFNKLVTDSTQRATMNALFRTTGRVTSVAVLIGLSFVVEHRPSDAFLGVGVLAMTFGGCLIASRVYRG